MSLPIRQDFNIEKGDDIPPLVWGPFAAGISFYGSLMTLTAMAGSQPLFEVSSDTGDILIDDVEHQIVCTKSEQFFDLIPLGKLSLYKLRRTLDGKRQTIAWGYFTGAGFAP